MFPRVHWCTWRPRAIVTVVQSHKWTTITNPKKKLMLVLIERWKCTKCSAACYVAADSYTVSQSQLPKIPTIDTWASELLHRPTEVGGLVWWITFCLTPCGQPGAFAWESRASWQRHCDAMGNGVLRNLGSWRSCGHYFDMSHLAKHYSRQRHLFMDGVT